MDDNKQKELIMDEIKIEELQEISGGTTSAIKLLPIFKPTLSGAIYTPDLTLAGIIRKK